MTYAFRPVPLAIAFVLSSIVAACSGSSSGTVGTSGQNEPAVVTVDISSFFVTVENRSGGPLLDVDVAIKAVGGLSSFSKLVPRLDNGEKRDLSLADFRGRDGTTTFSLDLVRPKEVVVMAADLNGQKHQVTVPWRR